MRALVTGGAGFIGSTLAQRLASLGWVVVAVDNLEPYYDPRLKRRNVEHLRADGVRFIEGDLATCDLDGLLEGVDVVFHQAGQPGVRLSWSNDFATYVKANVIVTQRLLESCRNRPISRFVLASSSSVYGDNAPYPSREADPTAPFSPYGVTKLASEHLARAYAANFSIPVVALRYFTVYGPRQRPDMAISILFDRLLDGSAFALYGDGSQVRDFTFIDDVVEANVLAATANVEAGSVFNIAGGSSVSMSELVALIEQTTERAVAIDWQPERPGDVRRTGADTSRAASLLGWSAKTPLAEGLRRQWAWRSVRWGN